MLTAYIAACMRAAVYEILPDDGTYYGEIPGVQGVWANEPTLDACRSELQSGLEDWIALGLKLGHELPVIDGIDVNPRITV